MPVMVAWLTLTAAAKADRQRLRPLQFTQGQQLRHGQAILLLELARMQIDRPRNASQGGNDALVEVRHKESVRSTWKNGHSGQLTEE